MRDFLGSYQFGTLDINGVKFPKVSIGTSPFIGAGQFGEKSYFYMEHFYDNPENITRILVEAANLGCNAVQVICYPPVINAVRDAAATSEIEFFVSGSVGVGSIYEEIEMLRALDAKCIMCHGSYADRNPRSAVEKLQPIDSGIIKGIATHLPGITIDRVAMVDEVQIILAPVNKNGSFMRPDVESTMKAIENARKRGQKVIAMKTLAAGQLASGDAFAFLRDKVDGVAVGVASKEELRETLEAAKKYFG